VTTLTILSLVLFLGGAFGVLFDVGTNPQSNLKSKAVAALGWPLIVWEMTRRDTFRAMMKHF
jgi:hypothetical protein